MLDFAVAMGAVVLGASTVLTEVEPLEEPTALEAMVVTEGPVPMASEVRLSELELRAELSLKNAELVGWDT